MLVKHSANTFVAWLTIVSIDNINIGIPTGKQEARGFRSERVSILEHFFDESVR